MPVNEHRSESFALSVPFRGDSSILDSPDYLVTTQSA